MYNAITAGTRMTEQKLEAITAAAKELTIKIDAYMLALGYATEGQKPHIELEEAQIKLEMLLP